MSEEPSKEPERLAPEANQALRTGRSSSSLSTVDTSASSSSSIVAELPWGSVKVLAPSVIDVAVKPGEFVAQTLLVEFMTTAEKKMQLILQDSLEKPLTKWLQRGEDSQFDQILNALYSVSEHCLPSVLKALFVWYDHQNRQLYYQSQAKIQQTPVNTPKTDASKQNPKNEIRQDRDFLLEKKGLAIDFIFCLVLIEVLKQLPLHPGHDDLVLHIVQLSFKQFRFKDPNILGVNAANVHIIADLFAEVVGVLAQSRFHVIRKKFLSELQELKSKENSPISSQNIVSLLMGMKFFRVKMVPIEEFEISMNFLHELGVYYLEVKERDREVKHALAGLFVEILLPVAGHVKTEVNVPAVKNFVELLYAHTLDLASRRKHSLACFPLLTCLLCISQKQFFLSNWHYFLTMCLSNLKHKDPKMSRVALESLYRLVWVYVVRIKCESNTSTQSRLQSICNSLFPRGGRYVIPRDTPLNIFVKILHFIAQERLDFAFKEVIFDLLCVGRPIRTIYPERMNIGLRALLVIADSLQQRDGPPPMPRTIGVLPSGNTLRVKRTYLTKPLTTDIARTIGIDAYYGPCIRAFEGIVRALDLQVGRPMLMTVVQTSGRETEDLLGGERKPKLDLFRTCIAAIPRILPDSMSHQDVIELLIRLTIHMDDELRALACQTLQNLLVECAEWREDIIHGLLQFITKEIHDSYLRLLDNSLRFLNQLLICWKNSVYQQTNCIARRASSLNVPDSVQSRNAQQVRVPPVLRAEGNAMVLHCVEGLALVMLCQSHNATRRLAVSIMKEVRSMLPILCANEEFERPVIDVLDSAVSYVVEKYVQHVQPSEKATWPSAQQTDFLWAVDKIPLIETDYNRVNLEHGNEYLQWDPWAAALSGFLEPQFLLTQCPTAVSYAWPVAHMRISAVFTYVDPNNPQNDTRASLLRSSKSKSTAATCGETLNHSNYLSLWEKYLVFACGVAPPAVNGGTILVRSISPLTLQNSNSSGETVRPSELRIPRVANVSASNLFRQVLPLLRCEMADMRDLVVLGLGSINPSSFECLLEELSPFLREAAERKQENIRRKKRKDLLRLQLIRILEVAVFRQTLSSPLCRTMTDSESGQLKQVLIDFIDNAKLYLESDHDREPQLVHALHLHFAKFISSLVKSFSVDKRVNLLPNELRKNLFYLFAGWSGRLGLVLDRRHLRDRDNLTSEEFFAVAGMCAVLTCGPVFDINAISDENGYIYGWMDALIGSQNEKVIPLSEETLISLLDYNADGAHLLEWVIDKCFSSPARIADKCFRALVTVFSSREYPCDIVSMLNLTLMYAGYPVIEVQQFAVDLLQILHQRFFAESVRYQNIDEANKSDEEKESKRASTPSAEQAMGAGIAELVETGFSKSQLFLSQQLAALHPEMTMQIFSEISLRAPGAKPARRAAMLRYLLPWLHNVELVDPYLENSERTFTLSLSAKISETHNIAKRVLKGDGWGSQQGTEMILNNLLYLTVKFGNEHANLLESLWMSLTTYWPNNLRVILRYAMVMTTLSPETLLPYTKRIVVFMARVNPERLVEELMNELQMIDVFRSPLERCELAPFYRWVRRTDENNLEPFERTRGTIHTRRHTPSDTDIQAPQDSFSIYDPEVDPALDTSASMTSLITLTAEVVMNGARGLGQTPATILEIDERSPQKRREFVAPFQLPMPAYGGHYCPLSEFLPTSNQQSVTLMHRSNLAILLITDLLISDADIEWTVHLPLMLHVAVLGLDHSKALVHDHCKQLLINLIVLHSIGFVRGKDVALVLISRNLGSQISLQSRNTLDTTSYNCDKFGSVSSRNSEVLTSIAESTASSTFIQTPASKCRSVSTLLECDGLLTRFDGSTGDVAIGITDFLASKKGSPLWTFEDITARNWRILSAEHLSNFVSHLTRLFSELAPSSKIETRWAQTALHIALCCSNRHYAGRSFQILRALRFPLTSRMLFDILSRLVETATEPGDDMQGYVTEIMLTLDSSVLHMEVAEHSLVSLFRESQQQAANVNAASSASSTPANQTSPTHHRSISHSVAMTKKIERKDWRSSVNSIDENSANANIPRSKSAHALKSSEGQDEHVVALSQLLWISVSLLESDYEHEYLLALRVLEKLIDLAVNERQDCFDRLDRMLKQLNWSSFPGLLPLVLKGCTFVNTYECAVQVLNKLISMLDWPVVDQTFGGVVGVQRNGFAFCVMALMPYMLLHYDDPTKLCICAAENIAEYCTVEIERTTNTAQQQQQQQQTAENSLQHLATVMRLYSKRTFSKECFQWTKCVVRYLNDTYSQSSTHILVFLTEVLDRGPPILNPAVLQLMFCVFHHIELMPASSCVINGDFLKVVTKHVQGSNWREASRILKLAVTRSSSFGVSIGAADGATADVDAQRRELPGRTMEFNLDVLHVVLGLTKNNDQSSSTSGTGSVSSMSTLEGSPRKHNLYLDTLSRRSSNVIKVREHLLSLLNASGLRIGLPKSPSVIFSQSSHDIGGEPPSSVYSSSGELTAVGDRPNTPSPENKTDVSSDTYAPVFKEFDFLEGEQDSISESAESCFNWLSTMRPRSISNAEDERQRIGTLGLAVSVPGDLNADHSQHSVSDSSDEEEESNCSQADVDEDSGEGLSAPDAENFFVNENTSDDRAATPASICLSGSIGTPSVADVSLQNYTTFNLECSHHTTGQIDEIWSSVVAQVSADTDGVCTANVTLIFAQLYREACSKMCSLVRDACHFLSMTQMFRSISQQFTESLDVLMRVADCPFLFTTNSMLQLSGVLQRQKYYLLELREHYETFQERREYTIKCLNTVKSSLKLQLMGQKMEEHSTADQEVELCRSLHKLFFQLLLMCENYTKMVQYINAKSDDNIVNLTSDVQSLHRELLCVVNELNASNECLPPAELPGSAQQRLILLIQSRDAKQAILQLRSLRSHHSNRIESFGCCEEVDVEVLLLLFCKLASDARCCFAIIGSDVALAENCNQLMEANVNLSTNVRLLNETLKSRTHSECVDV